MFSPLILEVFSLAKQLICEVHVLWQISARGEVQSINSVLHTLVQIVTEDEILETGSPSEIRDIGQGEGRRMLELETDVVSHEVEAPVLNRKSEPNGMQSLNE